MIPGLRWFTDFDVHGLRWFGDFRDSWISIIHGLQLPTDVCDTQYITNFGYSRTPLNHGLHGNCIRRHNGAPTQRRFDGHQQITDITDQDNYTQPGVNHAHRFQAICASIGVRDFLPSGCDYARFQQRQEAFKGDCLRVKRPKIYYLPHLSVLLRPVYWIMHINNRSPQFGTI